MAPRAMKLPAPLRPPDRSAVSGTPPLAETLILVIGELENRAKPVPVAFSSENLDMRHRLPDHRSRTVPFWSAPNHLTMGFPRPRAPRLCSATFVARVAGVVKRNRDQEWQQPVQGVNADGA